ncbi:unnamed protein product [Adineta ricciae]|uniref:Uncharacterized protein n=1 Tax=Adineta ricciae TaxID=249248 RepID=A0A816C0C9_ADIRI|nr:unnamed protein product [Adineta ricciae]
MMQLTDDVELISPNSNKRNHNYMCCVPTLLIGCILLGVATVVIPSLVSLYLSSPDIQVARSNANATDLWSIRYLTNLTSIPQITKRATYSPFDKPMLGRAFCQAMQTPSITVVVSTAMFITISGYSADRIRRQESTSAADASSPVYLDIALQALYPRECSYVVQCQKLFRERTLSKFMNVRSFPFLAPLSNGNSIALYMQLVNFTQHYELPSTDESTTTAAPNLSQNTTYSVTSSTTTMTTSSTTSTITIFSLEVRQHQHQQQRRRRRRRRPQPQQLILPPALLRQVCLFVSDHLVNERVSSSDFTDKHEGDGVNKRRVFLFILATTTTPAYCAATCTGAFSSSPNTTTCSLQCVDTGSTFCQASSTICANRNYASVAGWCDPASSNYNGGCNTASYCCAHDTFGSGNYYCFGISSCALAG